MSPWEPENHQMKIEPSKERRFLIVGGKGRMGGLFAAELQRSGYSVDLYDVDDQRDLTSTVRSADFVILSVPMGKAVQIAEQIAPLVSDHALLADLNSLKSEICGRMTNSPAAEVVGFHPMFGPTVPSLKGQKMVVCSIRSGERSGWLLDWLRSRGLELVFTDPQTHDRMMAVVQVLVHFSTLVMGSALQRSGTSIEESLEFTSPIYRMELAMIGRLFAQDAGLYSEIEMLNPYGREIRQHFIEAATQMNGLIESGDRQQFQQTFQALSDYFSGFAESSMHLSDYILACLTTEEPNDDAGPNLQQQNFLVRRIVDGG